LVVNRGRFFRLGVWYVVWFVAWVYRRFAKPRGFANSLGEGNMGIFSRLSDIIGANVHALLDRAENPERMLAQILREMEESVARAKRFAASALAAERHIHRELDNSRAEAQRWHDRARRALAAKREDLARRALMRKKEYDDLTNGLEAQLLAARETTDSVRTALRALEARLAQARRKQSSLLARHKVAQARDELARLGGETLPDPATARAKFDRLESKILKFEDEVLARGTIHQAWGGLEEEIEELETTGRINLELQALRRELDTRTTPNPER
jgi:phage shock protein A